MNGEPVQPILDLDCIPVELEREFIPVVGVVADGWWREQPSSAADDVKRRRGPSRFTQADVVRTIEATRKAQLEIACIRIEPDGSILVIPGAPPPVQPSEPNNPWDE